MTNNNRQNEAKVSVYDYLRFYLAYRLLPGVLLLMAFFMGLGRGSMPDDVKLHWAIFAVGLVFGAYLFEVYLQVSGGVRYEF